MKKISIVGSGLVGGLLGVYLAKRGHQVDIYERRPDMRKQKIAAGRSINLALSDRGWRGLVGAGIADDIKEIAIPMYGRQIHHQDGTETYQAYGQEGQAIYSVSRAGINMALMTLCEKYNNLNLHFSSRCTDMDIKAGNIEMVNDETKQVSKINSDIIFGADGAFSPARLAMQTKLDGFNYSQNYLEHGYKELIIPSTADGEFKMNKNALHIWPRKNFMLIALPNLDGSFTCTLFFLLKGKESFDAIKTELDLKVFFEKYFVDALDLMPTLYSDFFANPTSSLVTVKCFPWSVADKVCLLGDAAHAIVPFFGQGMNCGFEDCVVLDQLLTKNNENWEQTFKEFEIERKPNADAVAQLALDNFIEMRDKTGDPTFLLRKKIESRIAAEHPNFISMYVQVTFTPSISYYEAYSAGQLHNKYLDQLVGIENIFDNWHTNQVQGIINELINNPT
jgi:kynurenine 3-monooxygenase